MSSMVMIQQEVCDVRDFLLMLRLPRRLLMVCGVFFFFFLRKEQATLSVFVLSIFGMMCAYVYRYVATFASCRLLVILLKFIFAISLFMLYLANKFDTDFNLGAVFFLGGGGG